tara:strand:+ start:1991 stop:3088 length:1098 start_codon:yes stop_codon:yes gene_type:complete
MFENMRRIYTLIFVLSISLISCSNENDIFIPFSNHEIEYWGRIDNTNVEAAQLSWSGTSIKMNFEGESIQALMRDETGDNYYNIIIDNDSISILRPDTTKQYYKLASNLSKGKHSVEIFKRAEWDRGTSSFYGFKINNDAKLLPRSAPKKRKIEFYGNSITAGYAIEDFSGKDSPDSTYTNNYKSYAAITARHFDAEYQCICKSGIGITISWHPLIMPEMYNRLIPTDSNSKWDFSLYQPNVVVINLLQNDTWLVNLPEHEEFKKRFGTKAPDDEFIINAYEQFLASLRKEYPNANIICSLGSMDAAKEDSKWMEYINLAVANLSDEKVFAHFMPYIEAKAHPSIKDQQIMAISLIEFIDKNIDW